MNLIMQVAVVGGGVIGGGWVARFLLMGIDVNVYDPDPEAKRKIKEVLDNARESLPGLYDQRLPPEGKLRICSELAEAVSDAQWISECVPERLALKQNIIGNIQEHCAEDAIIASSTSGFKPSELQQGSNLPKQIIVAHPFNPVYLIPLVELVGDIRTTDKAANILKGFGCYPLIVRKEIDAHIADRLLEAVWRESLWLVNDGIATTKEIDDAIAYGFGLRWAQMGLFETYRIAGGEAGMAHFIKQFGPALEWPWTKLMDVPELNDDLIDKIASQSDAHSGKYSIRELERIRDKNLVGMMRSLKWNNWGAGELLNEMDEQLKPHSTNEGELLLTANRVVPSSWTDYNGHMTDSRYAEVFSFAGDEVMQVVGADQDYIARGLSYFTVDTKIVYVHECHQGDAITVVSRISDGEGKKLAIEHVMQNEKGRILATATQLLLHVNLSVRRTSLPESPVREKLAKLAESLI